MLSVTARKIAGFTPRWAPFPGFSLLFDNPGDSLRKEDGFATVACDVENDPGLEFYRRVHRGFGRLDPDLLFRTYLFCPLPPESYHVTAYDVANADDVPRCHADGLDGLRSLLDHVPSGDWSRNDPLLTPAHKSPISTEPWNLAFGYGRLNVFGRGGIALRLRPLDEAAFERFRAARRELSVQYRESFGVGAGEGYGPHVSIGYFANAESAELAVGRVPEWDAALRESVGDEVLTLETASLYAFRSMAEFFKPLG